MRKRLFPIIVLLPFVLMANRCQDKVKNAFDVAVDIMGQSLVVVWVETKNYVDSEEGTKTICEDITKKYENSTEPDDIVEQKFLEECKAKIDKFEDDFRKSLEATSNALEVLEHTLDTWDSATKKQKMDAVANALMALKDLGHLLEVSGVPIPDELSDALSYVDGLANTLKDM